MLGSGLLASSPPAMMPGILSQVKRESIVAALWPGKHVAGFEVWGGGGCTQARAKKLKERPYCVC